MAHSIQNNQIEELKRRSKMIGAIIGDIVGSRFEFNNTDKYDFQMFAKESTFTDDTICIRYSYGANGIIRECTFFCEHLKVILICIVKLKS